MTAPNRQSVEAGLSSWFASEWAARGLAPLPPVKGANAPFSWGSHQPDDDPTGIARDTGHVELSVGWGSTVPLEVGAGRAGAGRNRQVGVLFVSALEPEGNGVANVGLWLDEAEAITRQNANAHAIAGYLVRFTAWQHSTGGVAGDRYERQLAATFEYTFIQP